MPSAEFLRGGAVRFMRKMNTRAARRGKTASMKPERLASINEGMVGFPLELGDGNLLEVFLIDISEFLIAGDGFKVVIPIPNFAILREVDEVALFVNKVNSFGDLSGKFVILKDLNLAFTLETVFPKSDSPDPEQVAVALSSALGSALKFYATFEEVTEQAANAGDSDSGGDWDIGDILNARKPD